MPENDIQTTNTQDNNCIQQGIEYHNDKQYCSKEMNSIAKGCACETRIPKKAIMKVKDYLHYRGRGWGENCLEKSEDDEKYPDRVSPTFRNLVDIITNSYLVGKESLLDVYLEALKEKGITIIIDKSKFTSPDTNVKEQVSNAINAMDYYQCIICEKNDYMNDVLAEQAENTNLAPKNKYKRIIQLAASKQAGKDIEDKLQDEYLRIELFTHGLEEINNI